MQTGRWTLGLVRVPLERLTPLASVLAALLIGIGSARGEPAAEGAAPPATEAPPPTPASTPPAAACVPQCRSGFVCASGTCISACNPPCAAGQICTAQGECALDEIAAQRYAQVLAHQHSLAYGYDAPTPRDLEREARLAYRQVPRLTLGVAVELQSIDYDITGAAAAIGYHLHFARRAGIELRLAAGVGVTDNAYRYDYDASSVTVIDTTLDAQFIIGPFGRFYFGPLLWAQHMAVANGNADLYGFDGFRGGIGAGLGLLLLDREELDLFARAAGHVFGEFDLRAEFGLSWHFLLGQPQ